MSAQRVKAAFYLDQVYRTLVLMVSRWGGQCDARATLCTTAPNLPSDWDQSPIARFGEPV